MQDKHRYAYLYALALGSAIAIAPFSHVANAADLGEQPDGMYVDDEPRLLQPKWNELRYGNHTLNFHGYYRYGYGWTTDGEPMPSFQAPGALAKYRLGNEEVQGGEIVLDYRYYLDGVPADKSVETGSRFIQIQGRWEEFLNIREIDELFLEFDNDHTKEAFIRLGNFIADGTHIWFGRRFYDRQDIHMIDHFWLNVAQGSDYGGGIEGIKLWDNKTIDVAAFYAYDESAEPFTGDNINSYMLDFRLRGYSFGPDSKLTIVGQLGYRPEYDAPAGIGFVEDEYGFGLGGYHELTNLWGGGRNKTGFMFRQGAALVQNDFNSRAPTELQGYDLSKAWSIEANNDYFVELAPRWSLQWATVARYEDFGAPDPVELQGDNILWLSTGVRPMFYLTDHINIAYETGLDYIDNNRIDASGFVWKNTLALQFQEKPGYFERPVFRIFGTYANWSDDLEGKVATNSEFVDDTDGFIFGVQVEHWW
ncbi:MAG: carbohydrate porin [Rhodomicrobiaceae bacterium]